MCGNTLDKNHPFWPQNRDFTTLYQAVDNMVHCTMVLVCDIVDSNCLQLFRRKDGRMKLLVQLETISPLTENALLGLRCFLYCGWPAVAYVGLCNKSESEKADLMREVIAALPMTTRVIRGSRVEKQIKIIKVSLFA